RDATSPDTGGLLEEVRQERDWLLRREEDRLRGGRAMALGDYEVIDAHMHYGTTKAIARHVTVPDLQFDDPEGLERCLDHYGIDRAVLLPPDRMLLPPRETGRASCRES